MTTILILTSKMKNSNHKVTQSYTKEYEFSHFFLLCATSATLWFKILILFLCCFLLTSTLPAQTNPSAPGSGSPLPQDPVLLIGLSLEALISRYGPPQSVYAVRGLEEWQDDVVVVYNDWDLYIYRDRVWQLSLKSVYGISLGDPRGVVALVLGEEVRSFEGYLLYTLPSRSWPLQMRMNLDDSGRISAMYMYRSDF
jgi:hypothetical protein